jgi:hypothetical protein
VRRDSNTLRPRQLLYGQPRLALFASHAWHHELPDQDSNLQSRINNPLVYRLTDRGIGYGTSSQTAANLSRSFGSNGSRIMAIPASCGVRSPLRPLQDWHAATRLNQVSPPPRQRGKM